MLLKKSVMLPLLFVLFLAGCSGSDGFGLGNGSQEETPTDNTGGETPDTDTDAPDLALGTGSGGSFISGALTTSIGSSTLSYGGDALVTVNVVNQDDNSLYTDSAVTVNFTSGCAQNEQSTIQSSVITTTGTASASYSAITCSGTDTVVASLSDGTQAVANISVAGQVLGALEFVSATPATLALKGNGSTAIPEVSTLTFSLKDKTGAPIPNETITYQLSTEVGGITLAQNSSFTNAEGLASVKINAGSVNTSVVVIATVVVANSDGSTSTTSTTSIPIAIVGGIPDQDSFSISVETLNPWGWDKDGSISGITIRAADRYNNQARDGTQVSFVTNGGAIVGSCELSGGTCSVNWSSQDPRPDGGLVRILARSTGEETFIDANSNGLYDLGETVTTHLDEAFLDVNGSGTRDSDDEFFSDFNVNGVYDTKLDSLFQGAGCSDDAKAAGHCANLVDVRQHATLCMSNGNDIRIQDSAGGFLDLSTGPKIIAFTIDDYRNNLTPPAGTTLAVSATGAEIITGGSPFIPNECKVGGRTIYVSLKSTTTEGDSAGTLKLTVTRADGVFVDYLVDLKLF